MGRVRGGDEFAIASFMQHMSCIPRFLNAAARCKGLLMSLDELHELDQ
ncbi:MAG: hypothetical protein ACI835_000172 [Planctomycetota bacterium]